MEYDLGKRLHVRAGVGKVLTWAQNILLSQKVMEVVKELKGLQSLLDGLPLAKLGGFGHQNEYSNVL